MEGPFEREVYRQVLFVCLFEYHFFEIQAESSNNLKIVMLDFLWIL